ncbi:unnamed protein product [Clonostachys rosea]|uniref:Amino acid permease/ SLC12A domain-containing protein n=1 Tax=Bionectria ochroleuca TaxID=29856 RepID=A0ABY6TXH8_BIOOC|nr:unnamed protein product [Clonostachys rosea]
MSSSLNDNTVLEFEGRTKPSIPLGNDLDADDVAGLAAIGKAPVFTRKFNFWTAVAMTVCINATWEGISSTLLQGLALGGSVGLLYGYLLTSAGMTCVCAVVSEMASVWPSSGAQYHWTAELSPQKWRPILSWISGLLTFGYIWMATIMCAMSVAIQVQAYVIVSRPEYVNERWHTYLIFALVMVIYLLMNLFSSRALHHLNLGGIATHVVGFLLIMIILLVMNKDKHDTAYVFKEFLNSSGWSSDGLAFCIGLTTPMLGFAGIEMAAHYAEEIQHVQKSLPRAMMWTIAINSILTFPWLVALMYCSGDIPAVVSGPIGLLSPMTQIILNSTGNVGLGIFLNSLATYNALVGGMTGLGSCSRVLWAMARDDCFPELFRRVHPTLDVPVQTIVASWIPMLSIGLIYIGNQTAFYSIMSGVMSMYMMSYALPVGLHLFYARKYKDIQYGPWQLGRWRLFFNLAGFIWICFILIFLCFPIYQPVTAENMNYASVILVVFLIFGVGWYFYYLRGRFQGPVVEIILDDEDAVIAGLPVITAPGDGEVAPKKGT